MTRVNDERETQRYEEQKRVEEKDKAQKEQAREDFSRLVSRKEAQQRANEQLNQQNAAARTAQRARGQEALIARHGIQSQTFQQHLEKRGAELVTDNRARLGEREHDSKETRRGEAQQEVREKRELDQREGRVSAVSRDDRGKGGGAGGGGAGGDAASEGGAGQQQGMGGQHLGGLDAPLAAPTVAEAQASAAPRLPPDVIQKLVERVYVGVNKEGFGEFHIEFKESVLAGSRLAISARDGKVFARFHSDDVNVCRLLKASEGELSRAFGRKGLRLERLEVEGP